MSTKTANPVNATKVITGKVRLSYAHIFEPAAAEGSDRLKYSVSLIIPKSDKKTIGKIKAAVQAAAEQGKNSKFGGKLPKGSGFHIPLRDGDEDRPDDEAYKNSMFVNATSNTKPGVIDRDRNPVMDREEVYSGCYAMVSVNFYPFNVNGNKGVACGLNNIMKIADGEPLGGRISAEDDFAEIELGDPYEDEEEDADLFGS